MTTRIGAAFAAGFLAIGILIGAAGTIVLRDATTTDLADHMRDMTGMMGGSPMGPNASMTPGDPQSHHATPSPEATR